MWVWPASKALLWPKNIWPTKCQSSTACFQYKVEYIQTNALTYGLEVKLQCAWKFQAYAFIRIYDWPTKQKSDRHKVLLSKVGVGRTFEKQGPVRCRHPTEPVVFFFAKWLPNGALYDTKIACIQFLWAGAKKYKFSFLQFSVPLRTSLISILTMIRAHMLVYLFFYLKNFFLIRGC